MYNFQGHPWGPYVDEEVLGACDFLEDDGYYLPGDRLHTIFKKIWDRSIPIDQWDEEAHEMRVLPHKLRSHFSPSLALSSDLDSLPPLNTDSLPCLVMYHVHTDGGYIYCNDYKGTPVSPPEVLAIKKEYRGYEEKMEIEKMEVSTSQENSPRPPQTKEDPEQKSPNMSRPLYARQKKVTFQDQENENNIKSEDIKPPSTPPSPYRPPNSPPPFFQATTEQPMDRAEHKLYIEIRTAVDAVLAQKQLAVQAYPGYSYRYNGRHTLLSVLSANNLFLDLPDILTRYHINRNMALREIVRLDVSRHAPLIHRERFFLADAQVTMRLVGYQGHLDEVSEDQWSMEQPKCANCKMHHPTKGGCSLINPGLPALAASNNKVLTEIQAAAFTAAYASFDSDFQVLGPQMKHRVLNLSPATNKVPTLQFLEHSPTDMVTVDSVDYCYEYEITTRLLILVHKLQNSSMPIFIMPHFYGSPPMKSQQAQAAAVAVENVQRLYKGMLVTLCPVPHYKAGMTATHYHEMKQETRTAGDCLTAHLTARGLAALTIDICTMPVDDFTDLYCVQEDWKLTEPLYTLSGCKRREFYRRFADNLDKKIRQVDSCQVTTDMITSMRNRLSAWTEGLTYQSDEDEVD